MRAADVESNLKQVSGRQVSLKVFRRLVASTKAIGALAAIDRAANAPTVYRTSCVHGSVIAAFDKANLRRLGLRKGRRVTAWAAALARVVTGTGV